MECKCPECGKKTIDVRVYPRAKAKLYVHETFIELGFVNMKGCYVKDKQPKSPHK